MKRKSTKPGAKSTHPAISPLPAASPLAGFLTVEEYKASRQVILPTINSLRWFISENREELLEADALRQHRGRLLLHAERTDRLVDKIGKEAAERRFKGYTDVLENVS